MKKNKFKKILLILCVSVFFALCFCLSASATAYITDDNKLYHADQLSDIMTDTNNSSASYLILGTNLGAVPDCSSPSFYYTGINANEPTGYYSISGRFNFAIPSNVVSQFGTDFLKPNQFYTFDIPIVFEQYGESVTFDYIEFELLDSSNKVLAQYTIQGVDHDKGIEMKRFDINFNAQGDLIQNTKYFRIRIPRAYHKQGTSCYLYGGLLKSDIITIRNETNIAQQLLYGWNGIVYTGNNTVDYQNFQESFSAYSKSQLQSVVDVIQNFNDGGAFYKPLWAVSQIMIGFMPGGYAWNGLTTITYMSFILGIFAFLLSVSHEIFGGIGKIRNKTNKKTNSPKNKGG